MGLEMRARCERCGTPLSPEGAAYICSYECTFCGECMAALRGACPNCGNELVARPRKVQPCAACEVKGPDRAVSAADAVE